jgi:hypothetical protein
MRCSLCTQAPDKSQAQRWHPAALGQGQGRALEQVLVAAAAVADPRWHLVVQPLPPPPLLLLLLPMTKWWLSLRKTWTNRGSMGLPGPTLCSRTTRGVRRPFPPPLCVCACLCAAVCGCRGGERRCDCALAGIGADACACLISRVTHHPLSTPVPCVHGGLTVCALRGAFL